MRPGRAKASGDKRYEFMLLPFQGVSHRCTIPQGVALGYVLLPLQGEALNTETRKHGGMEIRRRGDTEARRHGGVEIRRKILCFRRYGEFFRTP